MFVTTARRLPLVSFLALFGEHEVVDPANDYGRHGRNVVEDFTEEVHQKILEWLRKDEVYGMLCYQNIDLSSSNLGQRSALPFGPACETVKTLEEGLEGHLGDVPSRFQYPTYYVLTPPKRCERYGGRCENCEQLRTRSRMFLPNPPFTHATTQTVQGWNRTLRELPCLKWSDKLRDDYNADLDNLPKDIRP